MCIFIKNLLLVSFTGSSDGNKLEDSYVVVILLDLGGIFNNRQIPDGEFWIVGARENSFLEMFVSG